MTGSKAFGVLEENLWYLIARSHARIFSLAFPKIPNPDCWWRIFPQHPLGKGKESSSQPELVCCFWAQFSQLLSRWHPSNSCCSLGLGERCSCCSGICRDEAAPQPAFISLGIILFVWALFQFAFQLAVPGA